MKLKQYFEFSFKEYSSVGQKYFAEIDVKLAEKNEFALPLFKNV